MDIMKNYQVNFLVKAVVSVDVKAETPEDAQKLAQEKMDKSIFVKWVTVHDETDKICGYDDDDMWDELNS